MEPVILHVDGFTVMGTSTRIKMGSENEEKFRSIWSDFESRHEQIRTHSTDRCYFGMSFATDVEGIIEYVAGMAAREIQAIPEGLVARRVAGADYAVFACTVQSIGETYHHIFGEWLPKSGHRLDGSAPTFEKYPPPEEAQSPVLIHIPIYRKEEDR
jgi:predicted transcriptional regulator YdeE